MKKIRINRLLSLFFAGLILSTVFGCGAQGPADTEKNSQVKEIQNENLEYFSLTETYQGSSGEWLSNVKCILPNQKENTINVHEVADSSQYPLTIYDKQNEVVYYSERVYVNDDYGDQLFCYDLKTQESVQLTDNIYAINYIFPVKDYVYMLVAMQNTHYLTIVKYDLNTKELSVFDREGVWTFNLLAYDIYSGKLYASACDVKEEEAYTEAYNSRPEEEYDDKFTPPDYTIFEFDEDFYNPKKIMNTKNKYIRRMAATPDGKLFVTTADTLPNMDPEYESFYMDLKTLEIEKALNIDEVANVSEYIYFLPNDFSRIYFIGSDPNSDSRAYGLCRYNINSQKVEVLYTPDIGSVNNCFLMQ